METSIEEANHLKEQIEEITKETEKKNKKIKISEESKMKKLFEILKSLFQCVEKFEKFYKNEVECWKIKKSSEPNVFIQQKIEVLFDQFEKINKNLSNFFKIKKNFGDLIFLEQKITEQNFENTVGDTELSKLRETINIIKESIERFQFEEKRSY